MTAGLRQSSSKRRLTICAAVAVCLVAFIGGARAGGATVRAGELVLHADGGFTPQQLPQHTFAPISFQGRADISSTRGGVPAALEKAVLYFDDDGRLFTRGLAVCQPSQIENATPEAARHTCANAIVGKGHVAAAVDFIGASLTIRSPLTLFNGPRREGDPTVVFHAQATAPFSETYVVVVPIEQRDGPYGYRATFEMPKLAGGAGALTHIDLKVGKRYSFDGVKRSYTSARCADGILETRGRLTFSDGIIIDGVVFKPCSVR